MATAKHPTGFHSPAAKQRGAGKYNRVVTHTSGDASFSGSAAFKVNTAGTSTLYFSNGGSKGASFFTGSAEPYEVGVSRINGTANIDVFYRS